MTSVTKKIFDIFSAFTLIKFNSVDLHDEHIFEHMMNIVTDAVKLLLQFFNTFGT